MHLFQEVLSVNGDVTLTPDHVLDQGDQVIIHIIYEGLSVNGDVILAVDHKHEQVVHVTILLLMEVSVSMMMLHSHLIMYFTREFMTTCT